MVDNVDNLLTVSTKL